jgi:hypothetical protein
MNNRNTAVQVRGVSRFAKNQDHTHTRGTRLENTTDLPIPVLNPTWKQMTIPFVVEPN